MLSCESYLLGHLALQGPGDRGAKGASGGVALRLSQFSERAPKPSLGLGAPPAIDVQHEGHEALKWVSSMFHTFPALQGRLVGAVGGRDRDRVHQADVEADAAV